MSKPIPTGQGLFNQISLPQLNLTEMRDGSRFINLEATIAGIKRLPDALKMFIGIIHEMNKDNGIIRQENSIQTV